MNTPIRKKKYAPPPGGLSSHDIIGHSDSKKEEMTKTTNSVIKSKEKEITNKIGIESSATKENICTSNSTKIEEKTKDMKIIPSTIHTSLKIMAPPGGKDSVVF